MAARLLAAGHQLTVWNRTTAKTRALQKRGARVAHDLSAAASGADVVITMLADGKSVTEVLFEGEPLLGIVSNAIVIDMSSVPPDLVREHSRRLSTRGIHHLDAPVSGGTKGANDGTLAIMVGGNPSIFDSVRSILEVLGRPTLVGPSGSGQLAKLANQIIVAVTIGAVAEALLLVSAGGANPIKVRQALAGGFADSRVLEQHGQRMLDRTWAPGGLMRTQVKDLRTILDVAAQLGLQLPLSSQVAELFECSLREGHGNHDHSALLLEIERRNSGVRVGSRPDQHPLKGRVSR